MRALWICLLLIGAINCFPQGGVSNMAIPRSMWSPQYGQEPSKPSHEEPSGQYGGYPTFPGSYGPEPQTGGSGSPSMWYTASYPEQEPAKPTYQRPAQSSGHGSHPGYYSAGTNTAGGSSDSAPSMRYTASYPEQEPAKPTHQRPAQSSGHGSYSAVGSSYSGSGSQQSGSQVAQSGVPGGQHQVEQESWSSSSDDEEEPEFTPVSDEDQVYAFKSRSRYNQKRLLFSQFRYTPTELRVPQEPVIPYPGKSSHQGKGSMKGSL